VGFGARIARIPPEIKHLRDVCPAFLVHFSALFVCYLCAISVLPTFFWVFFGWRRPVSLMEECALSMCFRTEIICKCLEVG
jgi:hypothetical protein